MTHSCPLQAQRDEGHRYVSDIWLLNLHTSHTSWLSWLVGHTTPSGEPAESRARARKEYGPHGAGTNLAPRRKRSPGYAQLRAGDGGPHLRGPALADRGRGGRHG